MGPMILAHFRQNAQLTILKVLGFLGIKLLMSCQVNVETDPLDERVQVFGSQNVSSVAYIFISWAMFLGVRHSIS